MREAIIGTRKDSHYVVQPVKNFESVIANEHCMIGRMEIEIEGVERAYDRTMICWYLVQHQAASERYYTMLASPAQDNTLIRQVRLDNSMKLTCGMTTFKVVIPTLQENK